MAAAALVMASVTSEAGFYDMGVYKGGGRSDLVPGFESWFGNQVPRVIDFYSNESWSDLQDNWWLLNSWRGTRWAPTFSISMLPGNGSGTLQAGAAGSYNAYWTNIANNLVSAGYGASTVRIGWEFNGGWYKWAGASDPASWAAYWRQIVTTMRAVPGANFRFDWCVAQGYQQFAAELAYPGDQYVDVIGLDVYNQSWSGNYTDPNSRWWDVYAADHGIRWWLKFANAHSKPISFPEWGTGNRPDGHGGGDDPYFIEQMFNVIATSNVAYHNYWDYCASDYCAILSDGSKPSAGARFKELFGNAFSQRIFPTLQYEAEAARVANYSGGTYEILADNNFSYAEGTILNASGAGSQITYALPNVPAGNYNVKVRLRRSPGQGIWQLSGGLASNFAGTAANIGSAQDSYSANWSFVEVDLGNWSVGTSGEQWLRLTVTGKNAASDGFRVPIDYIKLTYVSSASVPAVGKWYRLSPRHALSKCLDVSGGPSSTANGTVIHTWDYVGGSNQQWTFQPTDSGYYRLTPRHALGSCADVSGGPNPAPNGAGVNLWGWWGGTNQQWRLDSAGGGYFRISPRNQIDRCLDVSGVSTSNGAPVIIWDSLGGWNQQWKLDEVP